MASGTGLSDGAFRGRTALVAGALAVGSFLFAVLATVFAPEDVEQFSEQADAYSRSAVGHRAFVGMLRELGVPVTLSRWDSGRRAGASAALLVIEPRLDESDPGRAARLARVLGEARRALLVLPKWRGEPDPEAPGRVRAVSPVPEPAVSLVLHAARVPATLGRPGGGAERCTGGPAPSLAEPQFLVPATGALRPLVACDGGVLLGELARADGARLLVLSDPDLLSNHGLGRGSNALLAWRAVQRVRGVDQPPVLIDVALLGFEKRPSLWRDLFAFPLLPALAQAVAALIALVWAASVRVGRPLAAGPALAAGKGVLVETTVALLCRRGRAGYLLGRYRDEAFQAVARACHAPGGLTGAPLAAWLARLGVKRAGDPRGLYDAVERRRRARRGERHHVLALARRLHRFREEMTLGAERDPGR